MQRWRLLGGVAALVSFFGAPATSLGDDLSLDPSLVGPPISTVWSRVDGPLAGGRIPPDHSWLWGPTIRSITREPYAESPGRSREVYYFDKGRLEITQPGGNQRAAWYTTPGLLTREMISGQIQFGHNVFVQTDPAWLPLAGDLFNNPLAPTYASLAPVASIGPNLTARRQPPQVGKPITDLLQVDGTVVEDALPESPVVIGAYDEELGHNIPQVFQDWIEAQPFTSHYLVGHPLTEPYWIDTLLQGTQQRVLVQAFERRVLTYTPSNPKGWRVEAGNSGLHYRLWRGLEMPDDPQLLPLASGIPLGEVIVGRATAHGVDPFLFAALAHVASGFTPLATAENGGRGLFAVRDELIAAAGIGHPFDPRINADIAAREIARLRQSSDDWRAVLALYYTGSAHPDWSDPGLNEFVSGVLNTQAELLATFQQPPSFLAKQRLRLVDRGPAAYYSPSYTVDWWEWAIQQHASWGNAVADWSFDPNGYYCVHPDFRPGQRLRLTANGVTLWCTIGDSVAAPHVAQWRAKWAVELSYRTFTALGLHRNNHVEVKVSAS